MRIYFKNFVNLTNNEKKELLELRNSEYIRKNMYNTEIISFSSHLEWINNLRNRQDCIYWAILKDNEIIGCIDLTDINLDKKIAEWGFYISNKFAGIGAVVEYLGLQHFFNDMNFECIMCRVLEDNKHVYNMHTKKFGFIDASEFTINKNGKTFNGLKINPSMWSHIHDKIYYLVSKLYDLSEVIWE